jgi:glycosyltransferase involved in cell wall biosynthesis
MAQPQVTVLIDTYNYGCFIQEAIESVLSQDFPPEQMEILVVDDGSTDDTEERVRKYRSRINYFRKTNGGQASAFNFGLERARGEIVAFLDADDYWLPGKLPRVVEEFEKNPEAGMVYHEIREFHSQRGAYKDGGLPLLSGFLPSSAKDLLSYVLYPTSFLAFRRNALQPLLPIPEKLTIQADSHLSGLVIFLAPIIAIPECLAVYRLHGQNLFHQQGELNCRRQELRIQTRKALIDGMKCWLSERGYDLKQPDLRTLFQQWDLAQEGDTFALAPPGNVRFSRHLVQYARCYGPRMTWRHRAVTYANAAGSLVVGYKNVHLLDEWRVAVKRALRGSAGPVMGGECAGISGKEKRPSP